MKLRTHGGGKTQAPAPPNTGTPDQRARRQRLEDHVDALLTDLTTHHPEALREIPVTEMLVWTFQTDDYPSSANYPVRTMGVEEFATLYADMPTLVAGVRRVVATGEIPVFVQDRVGVWSATSVARPA